MIIRGATNRNVGAATMVTLPLILGMEWLAWIGVAVGWPLVLADYLCEQYGDETGARIGIVLTAIWWGWLIFS